MAIFELFSLVCGLAIGYVIHKFFLYILPTLQHDWHAATFNNDVSFAGGNLSGFDTPREARVWDESVLQYIDKCLEK